MSSAADMLEVGCPEPAPVLERLLSCRAVERARRKRWVGETGVALTSPVGAVGAGTADVETDPEASAIVPVRAAVVVTTTGPGIGRTTGRNGRSAGRIGRSFESSAARSAARSARTVGSSAGSAGTTVSTRAEILAVGETPNAAEETDSAGASLSSRETTLPARLSCDRRAVSAGYLHDVHRRASF